MSNEVRISSIKNKILEKGFNLNTPISKEEIMIAEEQFNIQFPEEYREFLLKIGNGGDGPPSYKILDLKSSIELSKDFAKGYNQFLSEEFPLDKYLVWEGINLSREDENKRERIHMGNLILGEEGCSIYWSLIITGAERGQVWNFTEAGVQPCSPKLSFFDWYEYWLDGGDNWWREFKY
jgi:hypothetical protein